jgi:hypothetical protein
MSYAAAAAKPAAPPSASAPMVSIPDSKNASQRVQPTDILASLPPPSQKTMVIMRGGPGSGKSYLAKQILSERTKQADLDPLIQGTPAASGAIFSTDDYFMNEQGEYVFDRFDTSVHLEVSRNWEG